VGAGAVVGLTVSALLFASGVLPRQQDLAGDAAVQELVDAWRRYRTGTFVIDSDWTRTRAGTDEALRSGVLLAQRPPDRILRQFGAIRGSLNGEEIRCSTDPVGIYRCYQSNRPAADYGAEVDAELAAWRSYVAGPDPLYAITGDGAGCFDLELLRAAADPPYGRSAQLCFDSESGALRLLRRDLGDIIEEQSASSIRTQVSAADFDLTVDAGVAAEGIPEFDPTSITPALAGPRPTPPATSPPASVEPASTAETMPGPG